MTLNNILTFCVTFIISVILTPFIGKITKEMGIIAHTNNRTVHHGIIPRTGGYAIYVAFLIGAMVFLKTDNQINSILIGGLIVFLFGLYDDIHDLPPKMVRRSETGVRRAMGSTVWRIALQQLAEAWIVCAAAAVIGWIITANIILIAGINITSGSSMTLQSVRDSLPLLYDPTVHFLAVAGIVTAVLLAAVTLAALIPLGKALRERTADILKDE